MAAADLDPGRPFTDAEPAAADDDVVADGSLLPALPEVRTVDVTASVGLPSPSEWHALAAMAEQLARSGLVPKHLRGKPDDVMLVLLTGRDLHLSPTTAINKIHVIEGKPTLSAELMCALVNRQPGMRIWPDPANDGRQAVAHALRDGRELRFTFTHDDAVRARLTGKDVWKGYPQFMLWARAVSGLCRMAFPDVLAGVSYIPEELGAEVDPETGQVIEVTASSYRTGPATVVDPDEAAREAGWDNAEQANGCGRALRDYAESIDPRARRRTNRWAKGEGLAPFTRDGHDRILAAAQWFADHVETEVEEPFDVADEAALRDAEAVAAYVAFLAGPDDGPPVSPAPDAPEGGDGDEGTDPGQHDVGFARYAADRFVHVEDPPGSGEVIPVPAPPTDDAALAAVIDGVLAVGAAITGPEPAPPAERVATLLGALDQSLHAAHETKTIHGLEREERRLLVLAEPDTPPAGEDPKAWAEWVAEVRAMTPPALNQALAAAGLPVNGRRPDKEARLIASAVV